MNRNGKKPARDKAISAVRALLNERYSPDHARAAIDVRRYGQSSVRIRIVDPDFAGKGLTERDDEIWRILAELPEETREEITLLLLLTPEETGASLMNQEFEHPTRTRL